MTSPDHHRALGCGVSLLLSLILSLLLWIALWLVASWLVEQIF